MNDPANWSSVMSEKRPVEFPAANCVIALAKKLRPLASSPINNHSIDACRSKVKVCRKAPNWGSKRYNPTSATSTSSIRAGVIVRLDCDNVTYPCLCLDCTLFRSYVRQEDEARVHT
jgi:hypothetical protein